MRPIDVILSDARHAARSGTGFITITRAELRQLKDYELVTGTDNPSVARFVETVAVPPGFRLLVREQ